MTVKEKYLEKQNSLKNQVVPDKKIIETIIQLILLNVYILAEQMNSITLKKNMQIQRR